MLHKPVFALGGAALAASAMLGLFALTAGATPAKATPHVQLTISDAECNTIVGHAMIKSSPPMTESAVASYWYQGDPQVGKIVIELRTSGSTFIHFKPVEVPPGTAGTLMVKPRGSLLATVSVNFVVSDCKHPTTTTAAATTTTEPATTTTVIQIPLKPPTAPDAPAATPGPPAVVPVVAPAAVQVLGARLAATGGDTWPLTTVAVGLGLLGGFLVLASRKPRLTD